MELAGVTLLKILGGALLGYVLAAGFLIVWIILSEWAIAKGWWDAYDDATMATIFMAILVGAPIVGGWKAWTTTRS